MNIDGHQAPGNENGSAAAARCAAGLRARIRTMPHSFALNTIGDGERHNGGADQYGAGSEAVGNKSEGTSLILTQTEEVEAAGQRKARTENALDVRSRHVV